MSLGVLSLARFFIDKVIDLVVGKHVVGDTHVARLAIANFLFCDLGLSSAQLILNVSVSLGDRLLLDDSV